MTKLTNISAMTLLLLSALARFAQGATPDQIIANNTRAIVYIQIEDSQGQFVDGGTGFIVTHDGIVVTAGHINPESGQTIWAIIGQRDGTRFRLDKRDRDEANDTGIWQLPQSASCRYAVTLTDKPLKVLDRVIVIGFPGRDGLTPAPVNVSNLSEPSTGYIKADGFLRNGFSGGPVFNEDGNVVALVHSGAPAGGNNDLVPISFAIAMLKKRNSAIGINTQVPFENSCYATCRVQSHGIESWTTQTPWRAHKHEDGGGNNKPDECAAMIARDLAGTTDTRIDLDPGQDQPDASGMWETSGRNGFGNSHVYYDYYCKGTKRSGPVYFSKQSPACGLWN